MGGVEVAFPEMMRQVLVGIMDHAAFQRVGGTVNNDLLVDLLSVKFSPGFVKQSQDRLIPDT